MQTQVGLLVLNVRPIYMTIIPDIRHTYSLFYQFLNSNLSTNHLLFSQEKPLVKPMTLGSILHHLFAISVLLFEFPFCLLFYFQIDIIKNPKIACCILFTTTLFASINLSVYRFILPTRD
ncbi:hypothetical protein D1007_19043 [Hordeum vulgare]|nr:hypothetical protein D1007_19043 [Hordeum vulgare]